SCHELVVQARYSLFRPAVHKALRLKSAEPERSLSDLVNEAARMLLAQDGDDLASIEARSSEATISYEAFVRDLQERGKLEGRTETLGRRRDRGDRTRKCAGRSCLASAGWPTIQGH